MNTTRLCWNVGTDICIEEVYLTQCTMHSNMRHLNMHLGIQEQDQDTAASGVVLRLSGDSDTDNHI